MEIAGSDLEKLSGCAYTIGMAKLLNLHRAARLVGVTRGALQKKIQDGELDAFDGMVALEALHSVYPEATLENDLMLEETALIKEHAFGRRVVDHTLPDKEVLAARLHELSKELVETKSLLKHARGMLEGMQELLASWVLRGGDPGRWAAELKDWLHQQRMQLPVTSEAAQALMVRDNFLRVMAAQVKVLPSGADFFVEGGDSLLEAALRAGVAVPEGEVAETVDEAVTALIDHVRNLNRDLGIPSSLSRLGFNSDDLDWVASETMPSGSTKANPRDVTEADARIVAATNEVLSKLAEDTHHSANCVTCHDPHTQTGKLTSTGNEAHLRRSALAALVLRVRLRAGRRHGHHRQN